MRRWLTALSGAALVVALPAIALAAVLWSMTVSPLVATAGQLTAFTVTTTNLDAVARIGCFEVDLTSKFAISSVGTPVASNGVAWTTSLNGSTLTVQSTTAGGRLRLAQSVRVTVNAVPSAAGAYLWPNHVHTHRDCSGTNLDGPSLAVTVVPALVATPQPTATPPPTPPPTPTPNPAGTPLATPEPTDDPSTPRPEPTPGRSGASPSAPAPSADAGGGRPALQLVPFHDGTGGGAEDLAAGLDVMGQLDAAFVWFVPGAAVGVPGLLVILFVVLQAVGALAWIPAVRRMSGDDGEGARRRQSKPSRA